MSDHERIWLQHRDDAEGQEYGRMWSEDKTWPNHPKDHEPTEYVRADLYAAVIARSEKTEAALREIINQCLAKPRLPLTNQIVDIARAALNQHGLRGSGDSEVM